MTTEERIEQLEAVISALSAKITALERDVKILAAPVGSFVLQSLLEDDYKGGNIFTEVSWRGPNINSYSHMQYRTPCTPYQAGDSVCDNVGNFYKAISGGITSSGGIHWNISEGCTTFDGTVIWESVPHPAFVQKVF